MSMDAHANGDEVVLISRQSDSSSDKLEDLYGAHLQMQVEPQSESSGYDWVERELFRLIYIGDAHKLTDLLCDLEE